MQVAIVADAHLISPTDPNDQRRTLREAFVRAWRSFEYVIQFLNEEGIDHVIFTVDLVDYYTPENRDFALELVGQLDAPWELTPGNHDFQFVTETAEGSSVAANRMDAVSGWEEAGVRLDNRTLDIGDVRFVLMDSALSEVPTGTESWLDEQLSTDRYCVLCTHVPVDRPTVVRAITDREPNRNLDKYVQRGAPTLFEQCLAGRVEAIFSGHLHFSAETEIDGTKQFILPLSIRRHDPRYPEEGTIIVFDTKNPAAPRQVRLPRGGE